MDNELHELAREVSSTLAEYEHGLRQAFPGGVSGGPDRFDVTDGKARLEVHLTPGPDRVIALIRLSTFRVVLRFTAGSQDERRTMLKRMDLAMRRGGG